MRCGNCIYWEMVDKMTGKGLIVGLCRRYPPERTDKGCFFPLVASDQYCGEYKLKDGD